MTGEDSSTTNFPANKEAESSEILVNITNTFLGSSDVEVTVYDANNIEVAKKGENEITETKQIEISITKSQFESHEYGDYTLEIKCTRGSITYEATIDVYYHP